MMVVGQYSKSAKDIKVSTCITQEVHIHCIVFIQTQCEKWTCFESDSVTEMMKSC